MGDGLCHVVPLFSFRSVSENDASSSGGFRLRRVMFEVPFPG